MQGKEEEAEMRRASMIWKVRIARGASNSLPFRILKHATVNAI